MKAGFFLAVLVACLSNAGFGRENAQPTSDVNETVVTTSHIEQFCLSEDGGLQFLIDSSARLERETFSGPYHSRIVVTQSDEGALVMLYPPVEVIHAQQATRELDLFLIMSTGTLCPSDLSVVPVMSTGVAGLSIDTDEDGAPDFLFER